jgi:flagellar hook assembly protein FlgD
MKIYDTSGNLIWEIDKGWQAAGFYIKPNSAVYWNGKTTHGEKVSSGVYFCHIVTDHKTEIQPLTLLK